MPASPASAPAYHLQTLCPDRSFAIVEARDDLGGTWDLFRYPGVRSDSDMHTLGYSFRPWTDAKAIADGPTILSYLRETAREYGIDRKIRFGHQVLRADWSSADALLDGAGAARRATASTVVIRCAFLFMCSGYYDYDAGHRPDFPGEERFAGRIVHPQQWPEDLDCARQAGRRHRQRRDRGDARAGAGRAGGARDHAAALADLDGGAALGRSGRRAAAPAPAADARARA